MYSGMANVRTLLRHPVSAPCIQDFLTTHNITLFPDRSYSVVYDNDFFCALEENRSL
jgi:hypothetical protein